MGHSLLGSDALPVSGWSPSWTMLFTVSEPRKEEAHGPRKSGTASAVTGVYVQPHRPSNLIETPVTKGIGFEKCDRKNI